MNDTPSTWKQQMRPVRIERNVSRFSDGSVLIETGDTRVICGARIQHYVPNWKESEGGGWVTAEYSMIPSSAPRRQRRDRFGYTDKRSLEIERVISRALRSVVDMDLIGQRTIQVDCDVIQAAGGTRTASITGGWVALHGAFEQMKEEKLITKNPLREPLAAISVGIVNGDVVVDLDYQQDSHASVDLNIAMTASGEFAEIQGTGEEHTFPPNRLNDMIDQTIPAIETLTTLQSQVLDEPEAQFNPDV